MKKISLGRWIPLLITVLVLILFSSDRGLAFDLSPGNTGSVDDGIQLSGIVGSKISYQGSLTDDSGNPLTGSYDMVFRLWTDPVSGVQRGTDMIQNGVPVEDGLFTVDLTVPHSEFDGQALWLEIIVDGTTLTPRQELLAVPYALSLKPGAEIASDSGPALYVTGYYDNGLNGYTSDQDYSGVYGNSTWGTGVKGRSDYNSGVVGWTGGTSDESGVLGHSTTGVGVRGRSDQTSGVVGWTGDDTSAGVEGLSDLGHGVWGSSTGRHGVVGISSSGTHAGVYGENASGPAVYANGDLLVTGAYRGELGPDNGGPFPRPAFDSGWLNCADYNPYALLETGLAPPTYSNTNFVFDLMTQFSSVTFKSEKGLSCYILNDNDLQCQCDTAIWDKFRVRIWYYR